MLIDYFHDISSLSAIDADAAPLMLFAIFAISPIFSSFRFSSSFHFRAAID
jgi:hypothetical protein